MVHEFFPVDCAVGALGEENRESEKKSPADNMYQYLQGSAGYVGGLFHGAFVIK